MSIADRERKVDPSHYLVPNLKNTEYEDKSVGITEDSLGEVDGEGISDLLPAPEDIEIVSQKIRRLADGTELVDIVVRVNDSIEGMTYEVRVAEASDN